MTWKRRLGVIGLFVVLVCVGVGLAMVLTPDHRPGVTKANFDKLQEGMSKEQVETLLGADKSASFYAGGLSGGLGRTVWIGDDGAKVSIWFSVRRFDDSDDEWKVNSMSWTDSTETPWQRICRWLRMPA